MSVTNTENMLFREFNGDTTKYAEWKRKAPEWIDEFCQIVESKNENRFKEWLKKYDDNDKKLNDYSLSSKLKCTLIRLEWANGLEIFQQLIGKTVWKDEYKCCGEKRWLRGVMILAKYSTTIYEDTFEYYVKEKWLEAFMILASSQDKLPYGVCTSIAKERWLEGLEALYSCKENARKDLEYYAIGQKWIEGINLLLDIGANGYSLLRTMAFNKWEEGVELVLSRDSIMFDAYEERSINSASFMEDFMKLVVKNNRYDWLAKVFKYDERVVEYADLSICENPNDLNSVLKILEDNNLIEAKKLLMIRALHSSCVKKKHELVHFLIESGADINSYATSSINNKSLYVSPLHIATALADYELVRYLLEHGAVVDAPIGIDNYCVNAPLYAGTTPLGLLWGEIDFWSYEETLKVTRLLLQHGAKTSGMSCGNVNVLGRMVACYSVLEKIKSITDVKKKEKLFKEIEYGCKKNKVTEQEYWGWVRENDELTWKKNRPVLHMVDALEDIELLKMLLECGYNVNARDAEGMTLIHKYAYDCHESKGKRAIELLIQHGIDINQTDYDGRTPLLYMLMKYTDKEKQSCYVSQKVFTLRNVIKAYDVLVSMGADASIRDRHNNNAVSLLEECKKMYYDARGTKDSLEEAEIERHRREENGYYDKPSLRGVYEKYGYDEDAVESSPEYWDYMNGKSDS